MHAAIKSSVFIYYILIVIILCTANPNTNNCLLYKIIAYKIQLTASCTSSFASSYHLMYHHHQHFSVGNYYNIYN